jgi:ubiquinone/menaquinone biosynthesis C-methylase UbiE
MRWIHNIIGDVHNRGSFATRVRRERVLFFESLLRQVQKPMRILDVGGTETFWEMVGFCDDDVQITVLNLAKQPVTKPNFSSVVGDARSMQQFANAEYDVVFSNSVIEHLGGHESQKQMANEIRRVGKRYFVQTPNRYFPIEPHFEFPLFQFMPLTIRAWMITHFELGWYLKFPSYEAAKTEIRSIRLLSMPELKELFPEANVREERFGVFTISLIAYGGWELISKE